MDLLGNMYRAISCEVEEINILIKSSNQEIELLS